MGESDVTNVCAPTATLTAALTFVPTPVLSTSRPTTVVSSRSYPSSACHSSLSSAFATGDAIMLGRLRFKLLGERGFSFSRSHRLPLHLPNKHDSHHKKRERFRMCKSEGNLNKSQQRQQPQEDNDDDQVEQVQGPSQAPTEIGVSTAGLSGADADLIEASYKADVEAIKKALDNGADVNTADVNGRTSLHFCAGNGLHLLVEDIIARGGLVNKQDLLGYTALHIAAGYRMPASVRSLLQKGADANIVANDGKLAVELAEDLLERTPKKRAFVLENPEYEKLQEIVTLLDQATELEDDEEEDLDQSPVRNLRQKLSESVLQEAGEKVEKVGDTTFTVRVKSPPESTEKSSGTTTATTDLDNVDVKITVKEQGSSSE